MIEGFIDGIAAAIHEEFGDGYRIYTEAVPQGLAEPCFFIYCIAPDHQLLRGNRFRRLYQFVVHYFPGSQEIHMECNRVIARLQDCLEYVTADGDLHRGIDQSSTIDDGILHFFVNFLFYVRKEEEKTMMEDLEEEIEMMGGITIE